MKQATAINAPTRWKAYALDKGDAKLILSVYAHLRAIYSVAVNEDERFIRPTDMDPAELLLASASLRTLFFESSPDVPIFKQLFADIIQKIKIGTVESHFSMFFLAVSPQSGWVHGADFFFDLLNDPVQHEEHPIDAFQDGLFILPKSETTDSMWARHQAWVTASKAGDETHSHLQMGPDGSIVAMAAYRRRLVTLEDWGGVTIGYAKNIPIARSNIVKHVANKLGGIHYDKSRLPHRKDDVSSFQALTELYDWQERSAMHAGLVATAVCCSELVRVPYLLDLYRALAIFVTERQVRLEGADRAERQAQMGASS